MGTTVSLAPSNATDTGFRAWCQAIHDALQNGGFVQTADTGQINLSTVTRPTANNTYQGYEIWRSNDATGGLNNFYFKIEYGSEQAGTAGDRPSVRMSYGWGSNGSGTLTGNTTAPTATGSGLAGSTTGFDSTFSVSSGHFCMGVFQESGNTRQFVISLERVRDKNGVVTDEIYYFNAGFINGVNNVRQGVLPRTGTVPPQSTAVVDGQGLISAAMAAFGGNAGLGTQRPIGGGFRMDSANILWGNSTSFAAGLVQHNVDMYGTTRPYIASNRVDLPTTSHRIMLRYD